MNPVLRFWHKMSRLGLREDETLADFREVILLNRLMTISPLVILFYIPVEIAVNGVVMLPIVLIMFVWLCVPLVANYFRWFRFAKYFSFVLGPVFIVCAGLSVGPGTYNHMALIALVMFGIILFKSTLEKFIVLLIIALAFVVLFTGYQYVTPYYEIPAKNKEIFAIVFFFLALVINFLLGFYFSGINREYEAIIRGQKDALADKNKEITDSITYAQRIQRAILPPEHRFEKLLPDSFVLYKPKDIVAGDFYLLDQFHSRLMLAVADCTGHGVPGAMVSVICHNALYRSIGEHGLREPAQVLDKTREIIEREFSHSDEAINDGMDISFCVLDPVSKKLAWAGANNPLLIIRNQEVIELKPDKQPVGRHIGSKPFTGHEVDLLPGDMLYLFSDGYSDQFGGPSGKKLKFRKFVEQLLTVAHLPCSEQHKLLDRFITGWRGNLEQVDDVCVIGVRL